MLLAPIYLTIQELREITGRMKGAAQIRWLRRHGFTVLARADGRPLVSRVHFETKMGVSGRERSRERLSRISGPSSDAQTSPSGK